MAAPMNSTRLGRTGLRVSRLCLGTMTFGLQCDERTSFAILDAAAAGGVTFLDTADVYPLGGTTETIGASRPEQLAPALAAAATTLAPDLKARLDELTARFRRGDVGG